MANWTDTELMVILPTKNVYNLIDRFENNYDTNDNTKKKFYRTYLDSFSIESVNVDVSLVRMTLECAWSIRSCLIDKHLSKDYNNLKDLIQDVDIKKLVIYSKEEGVGIEESITYIISM